MKSSIAIGYEGIEQLALATELAKRLNLPIDNQAKEQLLVTSDKLVLKIHPFLPLEANFNSAFWQKRRDEGKKQGLVKACKPKPGLRIIDATAGWGRDAAVLASFGAEVLMLERNPIMGALLNDALTRQACTSKLQLSLCTVDAFDYLEALPEKDYPDVIYIDPMHPERQKSALVKKDLQVLQQLIGPDDKVLGLIQLARQRVLKKVVVKWPQQLPGLMQADATIPGKTVRFDSYGFLRTPLI